MRRRPAARRAAPDRSAPWTRPASSSASLVLQLLRLVGEPLGGLGLPDGLVVILLALGLLVVHPSLAEDLPGFLEQGLRLRRHLALLGPRDHLLRQLDLHRAVVGERR